MVFPEPGIGPGPRVRHDLVRDRKSSEIAHGSSPPTPRVRLDDLARLANFCSMKPASPSTGLVESDDIRPSANKFSIARLTRRHALDALERLDRHRREADTVEMEVGERAVVERIRLVAAFRRLRSLKVLVFAMSMPPFCRFAELTLGTAGPVATARSVAA